MKRFFLEIAYDGTDFHGWQVQINAHTVQQEIHQALYPLIGKETETLGCGRTDTGVHAKQFYVHLDLENDFVIDEIVYKLNRILPFSIAVFRIIPVADDAHARYDATSRTYQYFIHSQKDPFLNGRSCFVFSLLDLDKMNHAAAMMMKFSDFTSFSKLHTENKTNICKISEAIWTRDKHQLVFTITADRFLRNMVRAIVGTLLQVGKGKISPEEFCEIIERKDRSEAGESVPACGLYLQKVLYPYIPYIER